MLIVLLLTFLVMHVFQVGMRHYSKTYYTSMGRTIAYGSIELSQQVDPNGLS